MKKIYLTLILPLTFLFSGCEELQTVASDVLTGTPGGANSSQVSNGLKQALEFGISEGVDALSADGGYFKDQAAKILLPKELQKVDKTLRKVGLGSLADEGLKVLNKAAEDAVVEAKPIFISAVKNLSISDAMGLLTSSNDLAATDYLKSNTSNALTTAFQPKIANSLDKVGANKIWGNIINKYNALPITSNKVNPDLTSYVTEQAINGLFTKIGGKEKEIRNSTAARTTSLLQSVFAMQD